MVTRTISHAVPGISEDSATHLCIQADPLVTGPTPDKASCPCDDQCLKIIEGVQTHLTCLSAHRQPDPHSSRIWEQFFGLFDPLIRHVTRARGIAGSDEDDCVQEVWLKAVARLPSFRYDPLRGRFCCWMFALIRNAVTDFTLRMARSPVTTDRNWAELTCCRQLDPAAAYEHRRGRRIVRDALSALQEKTDAGSYQVLHECWVEGRSVAEVSARLDLTPRQVRHRQHVGRQKLRRLLGVGACCDGRNR